jgi:hypothetical protein
MGGGLMQLVAYGAQDIYLTGNPQITFFKVVYRRHTNFSIEAIQQTFEQSSDNLFSGGNRSLLISRNGDLVYKIWLECKLQCKTSFFADPCTYVNWTNNTGHALIEECSIKIGGQQMDKHTSRWLDIWNELTDHEEAEWLGLNKHAAKNAYLKSHSSLPLYNDTTNALKLYIPLQFWFNRNVGLALPLIALQYHEVELDVKFREISALINTDYIGAIIPSATNSSINVNAFADYIYLDTDERRRFAQVSHEYLIEQLQYKESDNFEKNYKIFFNHPIKEIIWVIPNNNYNIQHNTNNQIIDATKEDGGHGNDYFNYNASLNVDFVEYISGQKSYEAFNRCTIKLNGHVRFKERDASYFRICQPYQAGHKIPTKHIYMYSFALNPEEHQPSGTCNFSRLDNAHLSFNELNDPTNHNINVYALNYNVLRIMSGMGGLAYSN